MIIDQGWVAMCDKCDAILPGDQVQGCITKKLLLAIMREQSWRVVKNKALCPSCKKLGAVP